MEIKQNPEKCKYYDTTECKLDRTTCNSKVEGTWCVDFEEKSTKE